MKSGASVAREVDLVMGVSAPGSLFSGEKTFIGEFTFQVGNYSFLGVLIFMAEKNIFVLDHFDELIH